MPLTIDIELKNYRCFEDVEPARFTLKPGFTAFIGKNNSGKSTLLRFLYEFRNCFDLLKDPNNFRNAMVETNRVGFGLPRTIPNAEPLFCDRNQRDLVISLRCSNPDWTQPYVPASVDLVVRRNQNTVSATFTRSGGKAVPLQENPPDLTGSILTVNNFGKCDTRCITEAFNVLASTLYIPAFRNAVNVGANDQFYDIQVGQAFIRQWKALSSSGVKSGAKAAYKLTREIERIFEFKALEIVPSANEETLLLTIDGEQYPLMEVGAGFAHFVMVLAAAAAKRPAYILIDEPELSLHASLQADFLSTLASYASEGVVYSTHSLGLARAVSDSLYSVARHDGRSRVRPWEGTRSLAEFVGALSFAGTPELGFDRVLLVEGTSDARTIQQFLRLNGKEHKVLLIPMGGASLVNGTADALAQLLELKRITSSVSALIDSERSSPAVALTSDREGFVRNCLQAEIECHVLERRSLENYFTSGAVERGVGSGKTVLKHFDSIKEAASGWDKAQDWRIAREMTKADLTGTDLGEFLEAL